MRSLHGDIARAAAERANQRLRRPPVPSANASNRGTIPPTPVTAAAASSEDPLRRPKKDPEYYCLPFLTCPVCRCKNAVPIEEGALRRSVHQELDNPFGSVFFKVKRSKAFPVNKDLESAAAAFLRMKVVLEGCS